MKWQPMSTYHPRFGDVLVWCDEGYDISRFSEAEDDGPDSMGHDAGWWGVHQPMDPGRSIGNPEYFRPPQNQPWAWAPLLEPPFDEDGEPLFPRTPRVSSEERRGDLSTATPWTGTGRAGNGSDM